MRQTSIETILPGSAFEDQALLFVTACAATVLIMVTFLALGGDERWHTFFRPLIPFIAVTAMFIPFTDRGHVVLGNLGGTCRIHVLRSAYVDLLLGALPALPPLPRLRVRPRPRCYGAGGPRRLYPCHCSPGPSATPTGLGEMGTVLIVLVAMMLAYALLPDEREMASIVAVTPRKGAAAQSASRRPAHRGERGGRRCNGPCHDKAMSPRAPSIADVRTQVPANWERAVASALADLGETSERGASRQLSAAATTAIRGKRPAGARCRRHAGNRRRGRRQEPLLKPPRLALRPQRPLPGPPGHGLLALHLH